MNDNLTDQERWLAAEYALGVLSRRDMARAEAKMASDRSFQKAVEGWQNQLSPMLEEVAEKTPPRSVWQGIEKTVSPAPVQTATSQGGVGFWKLMTAFMSTAAVGCLGLLMYVTGGDVTGSGTQALRNELVVAQQEVETQKQELVQVQSELAENMTTLERTQNQLSEAITIGEASEKELAENREVLNSTSRELAQVKQSLENTTQELAQVQALIDNSQPLVASLTQSGDAPAFVAQYDPLKQALLIRTTVEDTDDKVPEIWLIPDQGDRKGEVLSLGVMDENAPDTVKITEEFLPLIGEGGTLAITMEPPGGAPNGVATGPVIALGKLQSL